MAARRSWRKVESVRGCLKDPSFLPINHRHRERRYDGRSRLLLRQSLRVRRPLATASGPDMLRWGRQLDARTREPRRVPVKDRRGQLYSPRLRGAASALRLSGTQTRFSSPVAVVGQPVIRRRYRPKRHSRAAACCSRAHASAARPWVPHMTLPGFSFLEVAHDSSSVMAAISRPGCAFILFCFSYSLQGSPSSSC